MRTTVLLSLPPLQNLVLVAKQKWHSNEESLEIAAADLLAVDLADLVEVAFLGVVEISAEAISAIPVLEIQVEPLE